jgi:hypothetical protein
VYTSRGDDEAEDDYLYTRTTDDDGFMSFPKALPNPPQKGQPWCVHIRTIVQVAI